MNLRPSTKMQLKRAETEERNRARLIEFGWTEEPDGRWRNKDATGPYSFEGAVELAKLRGNIKSNQRLAPAQRKAGNPYPRVDGKFGKKGKK